MTDEHLLAHERLQTRCLNSAQRTHGNERSRIINVILKKGPLRHEMPQPVGGVCARLVRVAPRFTKRTVGGRFVP